ncbi:MAG TPA: serine/threonine-protein kinase [Ktedonobacterales bacterium]|nr:serine/threonine-protein kinase [Ktedonobacterales bacterium]
MTGPGAGLEGTPFGPWRLRRLIGSGGLGDVYLAERADGGVASAGGDPDSSQAGAMGSRQVAIKVLRPPASDPLTQAVLADTERAWRLRAAHVIPIYGVAQQGERAGVVMAWAPGGSLADALARRGPGGQPVIPLPMRPAVVARLISQAGRALADAHAVGLAHGDIKPSNIFVRQSSRRGLLVAISDFGQGGVIGLIKQLTASGSPVAEEPWVQERLLFTAPERLAGAPPGAASDQYALAAVAYYLLTGRAPVSGDTRALLARIPSAEPIEPSALLPDAPAGLDAVLLRALAKDPARRYESVAQFARALSATLASAAGVAGVTQEFSRLSGQRGTNAPGAAGGRTEGRRRGARVNSTDLPNEPPAALWRGLALATAAAALIAIATCGVSLFALQSAGVRPRSILASFQGPNAVATQGSAATPVPPQAQAANQQLRALVAQTPIFTDSLTSNQRHWQASGGKMSFSATGLDLVNQSVAQPALANAPATVSQPDYAGQVTMRFTSGEAGDLAGMRFYVTDTGNGRQEYYAFFLAPNGEYYLWYYQNSWRFLSGGYATPIKPGVGATNTISFVTQSAKGSVTLFANGSYIATVPLQAGGPSGGGAGLIILSNGVEATFSNFALYPAPHS